MRAEMGKEIEQGIKTNEKLIALDILLVIYLHDKRYAESMEEVKTLIDDPEMGEYKRYLFLKQDQISQTIMNLSDKRKQGFLQFIFDFIHDPA